MGIRATTVFGSFAGLLVLAMGLAMGLAGGCGAQPRLSEVEQTPEDLALGVTVFSPDPALGGTPASELPRPQRPAQYIVERDRVLRVAVGAAATAETFPPQVRRLTQAQFDDLWALVRSSGLFEGEHQVSGGATILRPIDESRALIYVAGEGQRRYYEVALGPDGHPGGTDLVDRLAMLAWLSE